MEVKKMETRKRNWKPEQEKIIRAFAKAFGISHIFEIGSKALPEAIRIYGMHYTGTICTETFVNTEKTGILGKELCWEYTAKRGGLYWYVFDPSPLTGDVYLVFETKKPRFEKILKHTIDAYEMLLAVLNSSEDELKRFWKINTEEETPWDAMRVRMWKFLHPINY
jgi:hypothetical protein